MKLEQLNFLRVLERSLGRSWEQQPRSRNSQGRLGSYICEARGNFLLMDPQRMTLFTIVPANRKLGASSLEFSVSHGNIHPPSRKHYRFSTSTCRKLATS